MKIAVLLSGRICPNNLQFDQTIYDKNINTLKLLGDDLTFFVSINKSADNSEYTQKFLNELNITNNQINIEQTQEPQELYNYPKRMETVYHNAYSMFYHNKRSFQLMEEYQNKHNINFDVIIKFRGDLKSTEKFPIETPINNLTVYIPNSFDWSGINDQIAYGDFDSMKIYSNCVDYILDYCKNKIIFHPETILKYHLNTNNLKIKRFKYGYSITKFY